MVECFDRIHLMLTETVLRPLRALHAQPGAMSATVRLPGRGCRIDLTVTKQSGAADSAPLYRWDAAEQGEMSERQWTGTSRLPTPEDAYWDAVDQIGRSLRRPNPVPAVRVPSR